MGVEFANGVFPEQLRICIVFHKSCRQIRVRSSEEFELDAHMVSRFARHFACKDEPRLLVACLGMKRRLVKERRRGGLHLVAQIDETHFGDGDQRVSGVREQTGVCPARFIEDVFVGCFMRKERMRGQGLGRFQAKFVKQSACVGLKRSRGDSLCDFCGGKEAEKGKQTEEVGGAFDTGYLGVGYGRHGVSFPSVCTGLFFAWGPASFFRRFDVG